MSETSEVLHLPSLEERLKDIERAQDAVIRATQDALRISIPVREADDDRTLLRVLARAADAERALAPQEQPQEAERERSLRVIAEKQAFEALAHPSEVPALVDRERALMARVVELEAALREILTHDGHTASGTCLNQIVAEARRALAGEVAAPLLDREALLALGRQLRRLDPMYGEPDQPENVDDGAWEEALCRFQDARYHFDQALDKLGTDRSTRSLADEAAPLTNTENDHG